MKRFYAVRLLIAGSLAVLVSAILFTGSPAEAQNGRCSLNTIKGNYGASISGWVGSGPTRVPYVDVGFIAVDGNGGITGESTFSVDGAISTHAIVGTYTVDPETCTGDAVT